MLFVMSVGEGVVDDALNMYKRTAHHLNGGLKERWGDAQQCEGRTAVRLYRSFSTKARRKSRELPFATRHSSFVIQKKSPSAFAEGLLKLGYWPMDYLLMIRRSIFTSAPLVKRYVYTPVARSLTL